MNTSRFTPVFRLSPLLAIGLMTLFGTGCQEVQKRSYEVTVKNESDMPVTVWLTKDGPFYEEGWKSPEDLAIETRNANEMIAGTVVRPGETQAAGPLVGKFTPHSNAVLRVYLGQHNYSELLAMSRGAPDRRDYELQPGASMFRIVNHDGMTLVEQERGGSMSMSNEGGNTH